MNYIKKLLTLKKLITLKNVPSSLFVSDLKINSSALDGWSAEITYGLSQCALVDCWGKEKSSRKKDFNFCFIFESVAPRW